MSKSVTSTYSTKFIFTGHSELVIVSRLAVVSIHVLKFTPKQKFSEDKSKSAFILFRLFQFSKIPKWPLPHPLARAFLCFLCHISNHQYNVSVPIFSDEVKVDTADSLSTAAPQILKTRVQ